MIVDLLHFSYFKHSSVSMFYYYCGRHVYFDASSNGVMLCVCRQRALLSAVAAIMEDSWAENTNNSLSLGREAQERHPVTQDHLLFT